MSQLISIIIPCFNHGQYIEYAIRSIITQKISYNYEIIIIDDGSTDQFTINKLNELKKLGFKILTQENKGLSSARNYGILNSKGEYFLPLDADNAIRPSYIPEAITILASNPSIGIVYGDAWHFGEEERIFQPGKYSFKKLLKENYIDACAIIRKSVWKDVNGYDINLTALEDWDFNLSAASEGWKFHYIPKVMFEYRILSNSLVRSHKSLHDCINYIAKKHGVLYRNEFLKNITITDRIRSALLDLLKKIIGRPNY